MPRPPLPVGTYGNIRFQPVPSTGPRRGYRARTQIRDEDGRTRPIERSGRTKQMAQDRLKEAIRDRVRSDATADAVTASTRVEELAERWFAEGEWAATTGDQYRRTLDKHVIPRLGGLQVRALTVGRVDAFLIAVRKAHGPSSAKTARSVLSGMAALACRHDALPHNSVRDAANVKVDSKPVEAFTVPEARQCLAYITYDDRAVARDLPDFVAFMFATSLRIGEVIAFLWDDVDLDAGTCTVTANTHRLRGKGLVRNEYPNNKLKLRTLALPTWATDTLVRRRARTGGHGLVFPAVLGGMRDPSNTGADLRDAFAFMGVTGAKSHTFRKTGATLMDTAGRTPRNVADQLGHNGIVMGQSRYIRRDATTSGAAAVLEALAFG